MSRARLDNRLVKAAAIVAAAAALTACGGGNSNSDAPAPPVVVTPTPPPVAMLQDMFGAGFAAIFNLAANSDPRDPTTADVSAVSFTTDPVPVP